MSPPAAKRTRRRRAFGRTWWGGAWVEALEQRAQLDPNRLPRGRSYARGGAVGKLELIAGEIQAEVFGRRAKPYQVRVRIRTFDDAEWDRLLEVIASRVGHAAALLDGEVPPEVVADAAAANVELLPGPGELGPRCSCPDWADPCKHSAAVCYLVADLLDADPFGLLLMRGRAREEVLSELRRRRGGTPGGPKETVGSGDRGLLASDLLARAPGGQLPLPPLPPRVPLPPAPLAADPPAGVDREGLLALAADTAARAHDLLLRGDPRAEASEGVEAELDLARHAARLLGTPRFTALAQRAQITPRELTRWAAAWRDGGAGGFAVLREDWAAPADAMAEGRAALGPAAVARRNRVTRNSVQLRLGRDGLWYRFIRVGQSWELDSGPAADPANLAGRG